VLKGHRIYFAHVGDSRGYIISKRKIKKFTMDHSYVADLVRAGAITKAEAENHPSGNIITRAVGRRPEINIDVAEEKIYLAKGQYVLLCSDGLSKVAPENDILDAVRTWTAPDLISKKLIELANNRGGPDNITVVIARIEKKESRLKRVIRGIGFLH
jgi:protein phosphatase